MTLVEKILAAAKRSSTLLSEKDVLRIVKVIQTRLASGREIRDVDIDKVTAKK